MKRRSPHSRRRTSAMGREFLQCDDWDWLPRRFAAFRFRPRRQTPTNGRRYAYSTTRKLSAVRARRSTSCRSEVTADEGVDILRAGAVGTVGITETATVT